MVCLRSFDAFPKVRESYVSPDNPAKPYFYLFGLISILFLYLQTSEWMGNTTQFDFNVDKAMKDELQINMQVLVYGKCSEIGIYIQDVSDDQLFVNELVRAIPHDDIIPGLEACEIQGTFKTNRVKGRLAIQPTGGYGLYRNMLNFNTSHHIYEFSFGEFYPAINNPLDSSGKVFNEPTTQNYKMKVVPTLYKAFGIEIDTNQYSLTESTKIIGAVDSLPGIYFDYDIDPVKVTLYDSRISLFAWLCRLLNIIGGTFFTFQAASRLLKRRTKSSFKSGILD